MVVREEIDKLMARLKVERDELKLKMHLGSMEAKEEFAEAEKKWAEMKNTLSTIADEAIDTSDDYIDKAKIVGEELKDTYHRIASRLSK